MTREQAISTYSDLRREFSSIVERLSGKVELVAEERIFILSPKVIFWLALQSEGLQLLVVRACADGDFMVYNIDGLLADRVKQTGQDLMAEVQRPKDRKQQIIFDAQWCVRALNLVGGDLLSGDAAWIQEYESDGSTPDRLPEPIASALRNQIR